MSNELLHAINETKRPRILVVGDLILDHYIAGDVDRVSREAPVPILVANRDDWKLGGAANVGANIVSMGALAHLVGVVADDDAGRQFRKIVRSTKGLGVTLVTVDDRPTTIKTRVVAQQQQMLRIDREIDAPLKPTATRELNKVFKERLRECELVIVSDYGKGVLTDQFTRDLIAAARKAGKPVLVDPKGRDYSKYTGATAITPNRLEAETATGMLCDTDPHTEACAKHLQAELKLDVALITLGPGGVAILPRNGRFTRIPAVARQVFDVTGAGDTFIATLAAFMGQGLDPVNSARLANEAAGIKVGRFGAAAINRDELRRVVISGSDSFDHSSKIVTQADLRSICTSMRAGGRRIVFTNGCFDILHAGHVTYLNYCRSKGDVLVLGLNSDASVRRQGKGDDRPVNPQDDRARVLAALGDVDFVCIFNEDTPEKLIRAVKPDVLVKGADWQGKSVAGGDFVKQSGGQVLFAPLLPGRSTTNTLKKMRKSAGK